MKDFLKQSWKYIIPLVIGFIIGVIINIPACNKPETKIEYIPVHDTITLTHDSIIYKTKIIKTVHRDTFYISDNNDTVIVPDIPIEYKEYKDTIKTDSTSAEVMIRYHGFASDIDSVGFIYNYYNKKETIVLPPKKVGIVWYVGLDVGIGGHVSIPPRHSYNDVPQTDQAFQIGWGPQIGIHCGIGIGGIIK